MAGVARARLTGSPLGRGARLHPWLTSRQLSNAFMGETEAQGGAMLSLRSMRRSEGFVSL